jgi:hypothetical protein
LIYLIQHQTHAGPGISSSAFGTTWVWLQELAKRRHLHAAAHASSSAHAAAHTTATHTTTHSTASSTHTTHNAPPMVLFGECKKASANVVKLTVTRLTKVELLSTEFETFSAERKTYNLLFLVY